MVPSNISDTLGSDGAAGMTSDWTGSAASATAGAFLAGCLVLLTGTAFAITVIYFQGVLDARGSGFATLHSFFHHAACCVNGRANALLHHLLHLRILSGLIYFFFRSY